MNSLLELVYLFLAASIGFLLSLLNLLHPRVNMIAAQPPSCHFGKNRFPSDRLVQNVAQKCCIAIPKIDKKYFIFAIDKYLPPRQPRQVFPLELQLRGKSHFSGNQSDLAGLRLYLSII